jgi:hypothetical protein
MFKLRPSDRSFIERARFSFDAQSIVLAPAADVLQTLHMLREGKALLPFFKGAHWVTGDGQVGDAQIVQLWFMSLRAELIHQEPGHLHCYSITECSLPLARQMLEEIRCTPRADGHTDLQFLVHYDPLPAMMPLHSTIRPFFDWFFKRITHNTARFFDPTTKEASQLA